MDFNEYQELAQRTNSLENNEQKILNGVIGASSEAGEKLDIVKKYLFQGHALDRDKLIDEASDQLWYLASIASGLGISLEDIAIHNIEKLRKRYPNGFSVEDSIRRVDVEK